MIYMPQHSTEAFPLSPTDLSMCLLLLLVMVMLVLVLVLYSALG